VERNGSQTPPLHEGVYQPVHEVLPVRDRGLQLPTEYYLGIIPAQKVKIIHDFDAQKVELVQSFLNYKGKCTNYFGAQKVKI